MAKKKQIKETIEVIESVEVVAIEEVVEVVVEKSVKDDLKDDLKMIEELLNSNPSSAKRTVLLATQTEIQAILKTL
tara:strand:- start:38 stop:265 length:228 start_codon:yes stop_codon:yes gene_type:complete